MPAAGSGLRFGQSIPKQYMPLAGRTVIEWALAPFLQDSRCLQVVIALAPGDPHFGKLGAARDARVSAVEGGAARAESVLAALQATLGGDDALVLVHDAARPCVSVAEVDRLLEVASTPSGAPSGALLALPLADTLKRAGDGPGESRVVVETPSRESLWRALTPQMFPRRLLLGALQAARRSGRVPTDEAQAAEWQGAHCMLVPGSPENLKVTHAADLAVAEAVLRARGALA